jgi:phosphatidylserine/phosphatidylglycerophosphate/cardiolipin synthase-like enzyme
VTGALVSAAFAATIVTCFAPEQDCVALAIRAVDAAEREVLVNAYLITLGSGIPAALIRAHDRGVSVSVIADHSAPCQQQQGISPLAAAGVPVWIDIRAKIAHEKALIIDRRVTVMGSYNWTKGAARNSEDLNVVTSPEVAETYEAHWQARRAGSVPFTNAADWCQR